MGGCENNRRLIDRQLMYKMDGDGRTLFSPGFYKALQAEFPAPRFGFTSVDQVSSSLQRSHLDSMRCPDGRFLREGDILWIQYMINSIIFILLNDIISCENA